MVSSGASVEAKLEGETGDESWEVGTFVSLATVVGFSVSFNCDFSSATSDDSETDVTGWAVEVAGSMKPDVVKNLKRGG